MAVPSNATPIHGSPLEPCLCISPNNTDEGVGIPSKASTSPLASSMIVGPQSHNTRGLIVRLRLTKERLDALSRLESPVAVGCHCPSFDVSFEYGSTPSAVASGSDNEGENGGDSVLVSLIVRRRCQLWALEHQLLGQGDMDSVDVCGSPLDTLQPCLSIGQMECSTAVGTSQIV